MCGLAAMAALAGCATYEARPLDGSAELAALAARGIPDATTVASVPADSTGAPEPFDTTDGLDENEAVAVALILNTDLQAARAGLGEADALLIQAGVLPNPELGVTLL